MELMPGYKRSDVGPIPEDWDVLPLGKLVRSVEYGSAAKSDGKGAVPVLRMGNLQAGKIDWSDLVYTNDIDEINKYTLQPGDVLFNRTNTIDLVGKTSIYEGGSPAIFAGYLIRINVVSDLLDSRFLNYILNTEFSRKYSAKVLSVAVGQANINGQKLKTYPIPLPPTKTEQVAIAQALSDVDALLAVLDQMIVKKHDLKQAAMQQLLTGDIQLAGFNKKWLEVPLGEIVKPQKGQLITTKTIVPGDIPVIAGGKQPAYFHASANRYGKTITVSASGASAGYVAFHSTPIFASDCSTISESEKYCIEFIYYALQLRQEEIYAAQTGGAQPHIQPKDLTPILIKIPEDVKEQAAIVSVLSDMDAEITELESRRDKTHNLKQAMMQELLTGKTRLV